MALILVMWVIVLMGILLGSFALIARTENLQSRHLFDGTTARYDAQAGLERAVYELRNPDVLQRWVGDGRPYEFEFEGALVHVEITDETGKIDINSADDTMLTSLFITVGLDEQQAVSIAEAILDWRDPDDLTRPQGAEAAQYSAAGLPYGPRNGRFQTVAEVQQVLGMNYELYRKIEPAITIYSGSGTPNPAYAPLEALRALPGMNDDMANQIIQMRQQVPMGQTGAALTLPNGTPIVARGGGVTYSIKSRATLPNGAKTLLDASIRVGGVGTNGRPYTILRWRDGDAS
jgi:general secretion pathway protein K